MVLNHDDKPVKETIEKALGDEKYSVRLGDDREMVLTYEQTIQVMNKEFEDSQNSTECSRK